MERRGSRLRALVSEFLDLQRKDRPLSRRPVRASKPSRQGDRQGADDPSREAVRRERLGAFPAVGARLAHSVDRILQIPWRRDGGWVGWCARLGRCVAAACGARLMQVVIIAAVAENGVIGRGGMMPWRLKS